MKGFDVKFLEELKRKNDIVDIIVKYVRLEQRGGNFWGKCPFHHEKTASFSVNAQGQFYYCFGCRKSGDVISFIMEIESLDFNDAVKYLADRVKLPLPEVRYDDEKIKEQKKLRERLMNILRETALFYVRTLKSERGNAHYEYAISRKITTETITKFGIGASPDFNSLPKHLRSLGYTDEEMVASGTCGEKNGRVFDWLGGRLIIPIIDQFNNVIAFVGRRIDGGKEQKYINTKETLIFSKGKTFFNLNNLKKIKNERGLPYVIIVEGHLDVVSLTQGGFPNVVASMGTALTKDQARILKRYSEKVLISYDGDFAGQKASIRGLEILSEEGLEVKVVSLPDGMDPDDVVKKMGAEGYQSLLDNSMPLIDFKLDILKRTYDVKTVDGKRKFTTNAMRVIKESSSPAEQEDLLKTVRDITGTTFEALKRELYSIETKPSVEMTENTPQFEDNQGDKNAIASRFILASYLFNKDCAKETDISEIEFENPAHIEIKEYILSRYKEGERPQFTDLYEAVNDNQSDELSRIAGMEAEENKNFDHDAYFFDCVRTLKRASIDKKINALSKMFAQETDTEKRRELTAEITKLLVKKKTELR